MAKPIFSIQTGVVFANKIRKTVHDLQKICLIRVQNKNRVRA